MKSAQLDNSVHCAFERNINICSKASFSESTLISRSTSMRTNAAPLELRINLRKNFAYLSDVTLTFTSGYPMMPQIDRANPNLHNLLLSEFEDLESPMQKTGRRVCTLLEEVCACSCAVSKAACSAGSRHLWLDYSAANDNAACLEHVPCGACVLFLSGT